MLFHDSSFRDTSSDIRPGKKGLEQLAVNVAMLIKNAVPQDGMEV